MEASKKNINHHRTSSVSYSVNQNLKQKVNFEKEKLSTKSNSPNKTKKSITITNQKKLFSLINMK